MNLHAIKSGPQGVLGALTVGINDAGSLLDRQPMPA